MVQPPALHAERFNFALVGDEPYTLLEQQLHRKVLAALDVDCDFAIHLGDIKAGDESCSDELLAQRQQLLDRGSRLPLVYVPGDNDWSDCHRASNGGFDPLERLARLRSLFFAQARSLGPRPFAVKRQSDVSAERGFAENLRWQHRGVWFVTINLPGGVDWQALSANQRTEFRRLYAADESWIRDGFGLATASGNRLLVLAAHADPQFWRDRPGVTPTFAEDNYFWFRQLLRELCAGFDGQVLLLHGDTHIFRNDQPLRDERGREVANFTRTECFGSPFATQWVHIRVTPGDAKPFFVNTRQLPQVQPTGQ